jgi:hypothetical protein
VRGASRGEGLGNQFLAHIRETAAIAHLVRCFDDENVVHVDGAPDPARDVETIETELALADLDTVQRRLERTQRQAKSGAKEAREEVALLEPLLAHLGAGLPARSFAVSDEQQLPFRALFLLTAKPVLYVANVDEASLAAGNPHTKVLEERAAAEGAGVVRISAQVEAELAELAEDERREYLAELGLAEPGLHRLIRAAYGLLELITYFTAGEKEVRAWTIRRGTRAPQAAGEIHTDFERTFIRAEVIGFGDYVACGGEAGARARGLMRVEGKEYEVRDGDVMHFRVGA